MRWLRSVLMNRSLARAERRLRHRRRRQRQRQRRRRRQRRQRQRRRRSPAKNRQRGSASTKRSKTLRFEGLAEKTRRISRSEERAKEKNTTPITADDLNAAMELGALSSSLPQDARERIDAIRSEHGFAVALHAASAIHASLPAQGRVTTNRDTTRCGREPCPDTADG